MIVSALILTYNEERNLPRCLAALDWCDDILVLDSGSDDATLEIARGAGARVLDRAFVDFASQRNFGLDHGDLHHDWVLHLDADEVVTPEFRDRLKNLVPEDGIDAYRVPSKLNLEDRWLRYSGMYPTYQVRIGHRDRLRFRQCGHGQREDLPAGRVGTFDEPYLHYNFSGGSGAWLRRHLGYAEDEARQILSIRKGKEAGSAPTREDTATGRRRRLKDASARLPFILRPLARFLYVLIWRRGFLDGRLGLYYAFMLAIYEGMIAVHAIEMSHRQGIDQSGDQ